MTRSSDFPKISGGVFSTTITGNQDAFVAKLNPMGNGQGDLIYATFLGGESAEEGWDIALDGENNVLIAGNSNSARFPVTAGTFDSTRGDPNDVFVAKLNLDGHGALDLVYATLLGHYAYDIAVDGMGNAFIAGDVLATVNYHLQPCRPSTFRNGFVAMLSPTGSSVIFSACLAGSGLTNSGLDSAQAVTLDTEGNVYVGGRTVTNDFLGSAPSFVNSYDATYNGREDVWLVRFGQR
jgi:hypothetical protein